MKEISQSAMLAQIDISVEDDKPVLFSLEYITLEGEFRFFARASKNFKPLGEKKESAENQAPKNNYRLKEKGMLRIFDHDESQQKTLLIDSIITFNNARVV